MNGIEGIAAVPMLRDFGSMYPPGNGHLANWLMLRVTRLFPG